MSLIKNKIKRLSKNELKKSVIINILYKAVGMGISVFYTPTLLDYLGEEAYGVWSTIHTVVNWINYFDIGIGNSLRNELAKDVKLKDNSAANQAVSAGYVILSFISGIILVVGCITISLLDCSFVFNTSLNVKPALEISFIFICINFILALSKVQLFALQQSEKVGLMTMLTNALNLLGIIFLRIFTRSNLTAVAILVGVNGLIINLIFSISVWKKHHEFIPKASSFRREKAFSIGKTGIKFFILQIVAMVISMTDNIIITRLFGAVYVTPYNTVYTAFGVVNALFTAMIAPLWSKYTVAAAEENYRWVRSIVKKLDFLMIPVAIILIVLTVFFEPISNIWLHKDLDYGIGLIPLMAVYYFLYIWDSIYTSVENGLGKVNLQMVVGVLAAVINVPLSIYFSKYVGLQSSGVLLATVVCMAIRDVPQTIYVHMYLNRKIRTDEQKG